MKLPPFWNRLGFTAKAAYLCSSNQARTYEEACSMLARLPRVKKRPAFVHQPKPRLPYADS